MAPMRTTVAQRLAGLAVALSILPIRTAPAGQTTSQRFDLPALLAAGNLRPVNRDVIPLQDAISYFDSVGESGVDQSV